MGGRRGGSRGAHLVRLLLLLRGLLGAVEREHAAVEACEQRQAHLRRAGRWQHAAPIVGGEEVDELLAKAHLRPMGRRRWGWV
eukprot:7054387-Prymnesium_polylepis.1